MPRTNNKKIKGKKKKSKTPTPSTKEIPDPVHLWVVLFHHENEELVKQLICDWDKEVDVDDTFNVCFPGFQ